MKHSNRMFPYMIGAAGVAAALIAFRAPLASLAPFAIVLLCPLMMVIMMRGMGGMGGMHGREDHTGDAAPAGRRRRTATDVPDPRQTKAESRPGSTRLTEADDG